MWSDWNNVLLQLVASSSLRVFLLAAGVGAALAVLRVPRGGVRHAAWAAVMAAMILMPILMHVAPPIEIRLPSIAPVVERSGSEAMIDPTPQDAFPSDASAATAVQAAAKAPSPAQQPSPAAIQPSPAARPASVWPVVLLGVYAAGVLFLLSRLAVGWVMMRRLVRASQPWGGVAPSGSRATILESPSIATPLTVGVLSPLIILPPESRSWTEETLRAVLAHEQAHVQRRDPLVAFVARVNRAIFWFNPLAWWLERALTSHAEDACDGAAIRETATPTRYAEVLMAMADTVRGRRGRVAWQGVGVDGSGFLGRRIDRILRRDAFREVSMTRKIVVGLVCVLAIVVAVACRQPKPAPAPLEPDPQLTARWAAQSARNAQAKAAMEMTAAKVAELEARVAKNPDDRESRKTLLDFYFWSDFKHRVVSWNDKLAARRRHILWVIANDPGGSMLGSWRRINATYDPKGYAEAKTLWLAATSKKDVALPVLRNAARFYQGTDRSLVEGLLLRAEGMDPGGPKPREKDGVYYEPWSAWLGSLYAESIVDVAKGVKGPVEAPLNVTDADRAFATEARKKLNDTTDMTMLTGAGSALTERYWFRSGSLDRRDPVDSDLQRLGVSYLNRAVQLDPIKTTARSLLVRFAQMQRIVRLRAALKDVPIEKQREVIAALPEADRLHALGQHAAIVRGRADSTVTLEKYPAGAKALWVQARAAFEDVLTLAERPPIVPDRGVAMLSARLNLSAMALQDNDLASALKHLEAAANVPSCDELKYGSGPYWQTLATRLLKWGERESVARFLDRLATISESERERLTKDAARIRAGRMPEFYQVQTVPH